MLLNREEMIKELQSGVILVNFTKVNGEIRNMRCTLNESFLPPKDNLRPSSSNPGVVNVYDVDKGDWRAFRLESVNHVLNPAPDADSTILTVTHVKDTKSFKDIILDRSVGS